MAKTTNKPGETESDRKQRLSAELRANLLKRKAQSRQRSKEEQNRTSKDNSG